jgi:predicted porin
MNRVAITAASALCVLGAGAQAQVVANADAFRLTTEGFINATVGNGSHSGSGLADDARRLQVDAGIRLFGQYNFDPQRAIGVRAELNGSPEEHVRGGERSLLYIDPVGRFEIGRRRGLPDSLVGYAPNTYAFTAAEFGVTSGRTLDPGAGLATTFLPDALGGRINAVSGNGASSAFFGDTSPKILYVSPKFSGFQLGVSYAPKIDGGSSAGHPYDSLFQTGLAYQKDFGQNFFRFGGSYSNASVDQGAADALNVPGLRKLDSWSLGTEINFGEVLTFGLNASRNGGDSGNPVGAPAFGNGLYGAHGVTASVNYNDGKWVYGGYVQRANGGENVAGRDNLTVFQLGIAYRIDTKLRVFAALYDYRLKNDGIGGAIPSSSVSGKVLLAGVRWTL